VLGNGIAFLPGFLCAEEANQHKLVRVLPQWHGGGSPVSLVYPAQRVVSPKVRAFIAVAEELWRKQHF
jgi:DNA-binding transcriptional LysR family regulator